MVARDARMSGHGQAWGRVCEVRAGPFDLIHFDSLHLPSKSSRLLKIVSRVAEHNLFYFFLPSGITCEMLGCHPAAGATWECFISHASLGYSGIFLPPSCELLRGL